MNAALARRLWGGTFGLVVVTIALVAVTLWALVLSTDGEPGVAVAAMLKGAFGGPSLYNLQATLTRATLIVGMALVAVVAFRSGCINLGGEGQMILGALAAAIAALHIPGPPLVVIAASFAAGALAGGLYAVLPALLQLHAGVPLLISSLLLNYPARFIASWAVTHPLRDVASGMTQTHRLPRDTWLPHLFGLDLHLGLVLIALVAVGVWALMFRSVSGYEARMVGYAPRFSALAGIDVKRTSLKVMALSGGIAGFTGAIAVLGDQHRYIDGMLTIPIYSWTGIFSALMAGLSVFGSVLAGFFFAALQSGAGGLERAGQLPREAALVLQALVILLVAARVPRALRKDA